MKGSLSFDAEGLSPTRSAGRSRPIDVSPDDEREFAIAVKRYKEQSGRLFPTCSELLEILQSLGYAKRIWKPVEPWSPTPGRLSTHPIDGQETIGVVGWYSQVETPIGI